MNVLNAFSAAKRGTIALGKKVAAGSAIVVSGIGAAMAQSATLGTQAVTEVTGVKSDINGILVVLVGVVFLLVAWSYLKRAK